MSFWTTFRVAAPRSGRKTAGAAVCLLLLLVLTPGPACACFGPKLYIGTAEGAAAELLFEIIALYVKEKTGTESVRVPFEGQAPLSLLQAEKADLVFADEAAAEPTLLEVAGLPKLVSGKRPLQDLQFTTVAPALKKLARLLNAGEVAVLAGQVAQGAAPGATARRFLMTKGWI